MSDLLILSAAKALLPEHEHPTPATIIVHKSSGKIVEVRHGQFTPEELGIATDGIEWIDAGKNIILPGLVEYVLPKSPPDVLLTLET